jgi:hypothetical protein
MALNQFITKTLLIKNPREQVGSTLDVPASWWKNNPRSERGCMFKCTVQSWDDLHVWKGIRGMRGAYFVVVDGKDEPPYPMSDIYYFCVAV